MKFKIRRCSLLFSDKDPFVLGAYSEGEGTDAEWFVNVDTIEDLMKLQTANEHPLESNWEPPYTLCLEPARDEPHPTICIRDSYYE